MTSMSIEQALEYAVGLHGNGQIIAAIDIYQQILTVSPENPFARKFLGIGLHQVGRNKEARPYLELTAEAEPEDASVRTTLALCLDQLGEAEAGIAHLLQALKLDPANMAAKDLLTRLYASIFFPEFSEAKYVPCAKLPTAKPRAENARELGKNLFIAVLYDGVLVNSPAVRSTTLQHLYCFKEYIEDCEFYYHPAEKPIPDEILNKADAVIFDYSFLSTIRGDKWRQTYGHLQGNVLGDSIVKVAIPQDEYVNSDKLDIIFNEIGINIVFSIFPHLSEIFYPKFSKSGSRFIGAYTGYIDQSKIYELSKFTRPFAQREIDVGTRVRFVPPWSGRHSFYKGAMSHEFRRLSLAQGFKTDIDTKPSSMFTGDDWYKFLGNCRFTIGCNGGASLIDRDGELRNKTQNYIFECRMSGVIPTFSEIEKAIFPGQDMVHNMTAYSPRIIEASLLNVCQILIEDDYYGIFKPDEHYIPLASDFSNIETVFAKMRDIPRAQAIASQARAAVMEAEHLRYESFARCVIDEIRDERAKLRGS
jgi:tetratricopeptide (TPR) repeat protein